MSKRIIIVILLSTAAVALVGLTAAGLRGEEGRPHHAALATPKAPQDALEARRLLHVRLRASLSGAAKAIDAAAKAVEAGTKQPALAELTKARAHVAAAHKLLPEPGRKFANVRCPMMGSRIDPAKVTAELTRPHKGSQVAFCCGGCPAAWEKLPDAQKDAKLRAAAPAEKTP